MQKNISHLIKARWKKFRREGGFFLIFFGKIYIRYVFDLYKSTEYPISYPGKIK